MNPTANLITPNTDAAFVKAVNTHFPAGATRVGFQTIEEAFAAFEKLAEVPGVADLPSAIVGMNDAGEVDPSIYEGCEAILAQVRRRAPNSENKQVEGIFAFVIFPMPTLDSVLALGDQGTEWLGKIMEKEFSHVAFRSFRAAETVAEFESGVKSAPNTLADYLTSQTSAVDTSTFDELWTSVRTALQADFPELWKLLAQLGKQNILRAIRSKSYAMANPNATAMEEAGIFVKLTNQIIAFAKAEDMSTASLEGWLESRDTFELSYKAPEVVEADKDFLAGISFAS